LGTQTYRYKELLGTHTFWSKAMYSQALESTAETLKPSRAPLLLYEQVKPALSVTIIAHIGYAHILGAQHNTCWVCSLHGYP